MHRVRILAVCLAVLAGCATNEPVDLGDTEYEKPHAL